MNNWKGTPWSKKQIFSSDIRTDKDLVQKLNLQTEQFAQQKPLFRWGGGGSFPRSLWLLVNFFVIRESFLSKTQAINKINYRHGI